jgi:hypothetical protein
VAKLGKAPLDAYNWEGWLIFTDLLKKWVAEGVTSEVNDFSKHAQVHFGSSDLQIFGSYKQCPCFFYIPSVLFLNIQTPITLVKITLK